MLIKRRLNEYLHLCLGKRCTEGTGSIEARNNVNLSCGKWSKRIISLNTNHESNSSALLNKEHLDSTKTKALYINLPHSPRKDINATWRKYLLGHPSAEDKVLFDKKGNADPNDVWFPRLTGSLASNETSRFNVSLSAVVEFNACSKSIEKIITRCIYCQHNE